MLGARSSIECGSIAHASAFTEPGRCRNPRERMHMNTVKPMAIRHGGGASGLWQAARVVALATLGLCAFAPMPARAQTVQWAQQMVSGPSPREAGAAMAYDAARGETVLFGGFSAPATFNGDTWTWNGASWIQRAGGPPQLFGSAMAFDAARGVTVLFGGATTDGGGGGIPHNETWEWNGTAWTQVPVAGPSARASHAMAYDSARQVTVLFGGGVNFGDVNGQTWEWNGNVWDQRLPATSPPARNSHRMAYDSCRHVTVLFGGHTASEQFNDETWEWNGTDWVQRHPETNPPPRYLHAMAYDAARHVTVLFGGYSGGHVPDGDAWEWDGTTWTQRLDSGPSSRDDHSLVYDSARGVAVLFGGATHISPDVESGETWELSCIAFAAQPLPQTASCHEGSALFAVSASGSGSLFYQWRRNGANVANVLGHIDGATTAVLHFVTVAVADEGQYDCFVSSACGTNTSRSAPLLVISADFNRDGQVNVADYLAFLAAYAAGC
jgi:hypothetical protein